MHDAFFFFSIIFVRLCYSPAFAVESCADAHKFINRNLSSSETLNRIKDNKLEISGWTIYDCGDFTKKQHTHIIRRQTAQRMATHRFKYHTWISTYELKRKQEQKKIQNNWNIKGDEQMEKYDCY